MSAKNAKNAGDTDLSKTDLDSFTPQDRSYAQQLAEDYFSDYNIAMHLGETLHEEYAEAPLDWGSDNNYVPNIETALEWAQQILKKNNANAGKTYPSICYSCLTNSFSYKYKEILANSTAARPDMDKLQCEGCFHSLTQSVFNKIKSGEITPEEARKIAAYEFEKTEGWETDLSTLAYDGTPKLESWHASQIVKSFNFLEALLRGHEMRVMNPKAIEEHFPTAEEQLNNLRINVQDQNQTAFRIGFLYHDAWWKARHEDAARKYYEIQDNNRKNGKNGGQAETRIKRLKALDRLARDNIKKFNMASDKEAIREAKRLARSHDKGSDEPLFHNKGKLLSDEWFAEWRDAFRKTAREI